MCEKITCPHCGSDNVKKHNNRRTKQRFYCKEPTCGKWFSVLRTDIEILPVVEKLKVEIPEFLEKRILFFDIETAPTRASVWGRWKQNVGLNQVLSEGYVLCYAAKWLGTKNVFLDALPFYKDYKNKKFKENDYNVVRSLWNLLDQADIVIAHNAARFDVPLMNSRFVFWGMTPPSPYKVVDTLLIARGVFKFPSNSLDSLGAYLKVGRKIHNTGMDLWNRCIDRDKEAWKEMLEYNDGDVVLLEKVYMKLRAWDKKAPNVAVYTDDTTARCTVCGSEDLIAGSFPVYTNLSSFASYSCNNCGHWNRGRSNNFSLLKRKSLVANIV